MEPNPFILEILIQKLGWTLVHFLWQGAIVWVLAKILFYFLRNRSAASRYWAACFLFFGMIALPVVTFCVVHVETPRIVEFQESISRIVAPLPATPAPRSPEEPSAPISGLSFAEPLPSPPAPSLPWHERVVSAVQPYLPVMVGIWILGVIALSVRHLFGWFLVQRMKRRYLDPIGERIEQQVADLSERIRISRPVKIFQSTLAAAPLTIGWIRPMILLPASALSGLSPAQLEAILAHELAHIRRFDYPINLLQTLIETLLFYHPAVWRLSKRIRIERENCCDDIAVEVCGDAVAYAKTLAEVADLQTRPGLAIGMGDGSLIDRVRRLIGKTREEEAWSSAGWVSGVLAVTLLGAVSCIAVPHSELKASENEEEPWKRALSDGFTIELIGVSTHPSAEGSWWTPDGCRMEGLFYPPDQGRWVTGRTAYEFAFRIPETGYRAIRWQAEGSSTGLSYAEDEGGNQIKTLLTSAGAFDSDKERVDLRLRVPVGEWKTVQEYDPTEQGGTTGSSREEGTVVFHSPVERGASVILIVSHNHMNLDARVIARTSAGEFTPSRTSSSGTDAFTSGEYTFDASISEIEKFEFQTRPLEEVVFEGAALRPDASLPPVSIEPVMPTDSGEFEFDSSDLLGRWVGGGGILPIIHTFSEGGVYRSEVAYATGSTLLNEGTWELKGDRLIRDGSEESAARIVEFDGDSFVVEYKDGDRWGYRRTLYERVGEEEQVQTGAVEGHVFIGEEPTESQISYGSYDPIDGPRSQKPIETDSEGRFVVEDLPPGKYQFSRLVEYVIQNEGGSTSNWTGTHGASAEVVAGATASIRIGGEGRTIRGRVVAKPNEDGEEFSIGSLESRTMHRLTGRYSPFGVVLDFDEDGAFEIPDVLPGTYSPHFSSLPNFTEPDRHVVPTPSTFTIPEATPGSPGVYDVGTIDARLAPETKPHIEEKKSDAQTGAVEGRVIIDGDGLTPLHIAARNGRFDEVKRLVEEGAEINAKTNDGKTPWREAAYNGHHGIANWLREQGAEWETIDPR